MRQPDWSIDLDRAIRVHEIPNYTAINDEYLEAIETAKLKRMDNIFHAVGKEKLRDGSTYVTRTAGSGFQLVEYNYDDFTAEELEERDVRSVWAHS